ncbi:hypothetical protein NEOLEDRAFT_347395 [Neolentinus lepideus HHB14362 ss-1]|uniref:Uncharacterized protein n=1 Tax=Neolentinus lepideus HHB14362 ss-1 TaxID=1314782 RepID=A0A165SQN6_9AGAM|nr:hypothetical protein NEOLEDRAFT_347395 [Neolentinus lepideus HHB14362 ss-1]
MAVTGVCIGTLMPRNFTVYFDEDCDEHTPDNHRRLTLSSSPVILHGIDILMRCPVVCIVHAACLFLVAVIIFCATVEFGGNEQSSSRVGFALVSCVLSFIFWYVYFDVNIRLSIRHRNFRNGVPRRMDRIYLLEDNGKGDVESDNLTERHYFQSDVVGAAEAQRRGRVSIEVT